MEQPCFAGIEVFRCCSVEIADFGMQSTNEAKHLAVVDDWEDDPIPEAVDQSAAAGHSGATGGRHFVVADHMLPEIVDEVVQPAGEADFGGRRDGWFLLERGGCCGFVACWRTGAG